MLLLFVSCVSTPSWVDQYPNNSEYFTGIGLSNSGDREKDLEAAYNSALKSLASEISISVQSVSSSNKTITADEICREIDMKVTHYISTKVDINLKNIEIVDSYYQKNVGQWIYLRLNKQKWNEFELNEVDKLHTSIKNTLDSLSGSYSEQLVEILEFEETIYEHPFSYKVDAGLLSRIMDRKSELNYLNRKFTIIVENSSPLYQIRKHILLSYFNFLDKKKYKDYSLRISFEFNDFPEYSKKLKASSLTIIYQLENEGDVINTWLDKKYKGVGLDIKQAHENAYINYTADLTPDKINSWLSKL